MGKDYLRSPSRMEWMEIERHFATTWNFPHVWGQSMESISRFSHVAWVHSITTIIVELVPFQPTNV